MMFAVARGLPQTAMLVRAKAVLLDQRSRIYSKPPKEIIGPVQTFFTISVFAASLLVPAGWIMHYIPDYRKTTCPVEDNDRIM
ncbi:hypothetical protein GJAV_G00011970 [Gymnothorax javanicus]|nr:hypothetical protein GJAV_G00011970 [Gymnothorax javanicus]